MKEFIGTIEASEYCNVTRPTIRKWVDMKWVDGYVTEGGTAKISVKSLISTLKNNKMPVPQELMDVCGNRILIVDDDYDTVQMISTAINQQKFFICEASTNAYDACIKIGSFKPQIVILDLLMPFMDGAEFIKEIRRNKDLDNVKIIIITGHPESEIAESAKRIGIDKLIAKPFEIDELFEIIKEFSNLPHEKKKRKRRTKKEMELAAKS